MSTRVADLPQDLEALRALVLEQRAALDARNERIAFLEHHNRQLLRLVFGRSSEKRLATESVDDRQGFLFAAEIAEEAARVAEETGVKTSVEVTRPPGEPKAGKKRGRRSQFPPDAPVVTTRVELPEGERSCSCCGGDLHEIGAETSRELERIEMTIVHEIQRVKYACRSCEKAAKTPRYRGKVIEKGLLGPGFLAHVIVERFGNHMPYHRLEKKYASEGLALSRSVLQASMARCAELMLPISMEIRRRALASGVIFTDDTPVKIAVTPEGPKQGRVWVYLDREGNHAYDFTENHKRDGPLAVLRDYEGYAHADAYLGYDELYLPGKVIEVACWAHLRRKFLEAETSDPDLVREALARLRELFRIEEEAKRTGLDAAGVVALRQAQSRPRVEEFWAWLESAATQALPRGPFGAAYKYARNQRVAFERYLEDGRLEMTNNAAERALRPIAVGRKNWEFFQRIAGGPVAAILLGPLMTAKSVGVNPREYYRDVLTRIATESDVRTLVPQEWKRIHLPEIEARRGRVLGQILGSPA